MWTETRHAKDKDLTFGRYFKNVDKRGDIELKDKDDMKFLIDLFEDYTGKKVSEEEAKQIIETFKLV